MTQLTTEQLHQWIITGKIPPGYMVKQIAEDRPHRLTRFWDVLGRYDGDRWITIAKRKPTTRKPSQA